MLCIIVKPERIICPGGIGFSPRIFQRQFILLITCSAPLQAQARIKFLQRHRLPTSPSQLGSLWHTIALGAITEADIQGGPPITRFSRRLRSLRAASCVIWLADNNANKSTVVATPPDDPYAVPRQWPVADGSGASSSRPQWEQRPPSSTGPAAAI